MQIVAREDLATMIRARAEGSARFLVAIAGAPGAGKSTLSETLLADLGAEAQVVPMDGYHLDNAELDAMGLRHRKGAPETFDVQGFSRLVAQLKSGGPVDYPTFDRVADATVPGGGHVSADTRIVLVEGNYLLMNAPGWDRLQPFWDMAIWIDVPLAELEARLIQRWLDHGMPQDAAEARARDNDMVNARAVIDASVGGEVSASGHRYLVLDRT